MMTPPPPQNRRVLHVDSGLAMRGGQWQLLALARGLRKLGLVEQRLLARGELLARLRAEGFDAEESSFRRLRPAGFDLVHAHDARSHTWAALRGARPLIVARRVAFPVKTGPLSRWKYRRADRFIAVSKFVAGRLADAGVDAARIRVVYDGVECPPPPSPPSGAAGRPGGLLLSPFFDDSQKGNVILSETGLEVKYSSALVTDLSEARVFIYLSKEEGLGSAVLLAQAAGVPVVASGVGGLREIVRHEETGLITENNPGAVRAAVERLLADPPLAARLAANARRQYEERFRVETMVAATLAVYDEVWQRS